MKEKSKEAITTRSQRGKKGSTAAKRLIGGTSATQVSNLKLKSVPKSEITSFKRKNGKTKLRNKQFDNSVAVGYKRMKEIVVPSPEKRTELIDCEDNDLCETQSAEYNNKKNGSFSNEERPRSNDNDEVRNIMESDIDSDDCSNDDDNAFEVKDADEFINGNPEHISEDNESTYDARSDIDSDAGDFTTIDSAPKKIRKNRKLNTDDDITVNVDQPCEDWLEGSDDDEQNAFPIIEDLAAAKERIRRTVGQLTAFSGKSNATQAQKSRKSRSELMSRLTNDIVVYYGYSAELAEYFLQMFKPAEAVSFFEAAESSRPVTLRTNSLMTRRRDLAKLLIARGANVDPIGEWTKVGLKLIDSTVPIGATPEYCSGHYMLQSASSFLPVLALDPKPGEVILDMAAAPGGKSTYIGQLMKNSGVLFCNELKKDRCASLVANIHRLGLTNTIVVNMDGLELKGRLPPLDRVLLDAPCSGLGVISRDLSVKVKRTPKDFKEQSAVQKKLLAAAVDMVNPLSTLGGIVVYSTCSLSIEENEEVIDYILKCRDVKVVPVDFELGEPGFSRYRGKTFHPSIKNARRIYPHIHNMDGFFVCKLKKLSNKIPERIQRDRRKRNCYVKDWGEEKWKPEFLNEASTFEEENDDIETRDDSDGCSSDDYDTEM